MAVISTTITFSGFEPGIKWHWFFLLFFLFCFLSQDGAIWVWCIDGYFFNHRCINGYL